jgi:hypothetical protein
MGQAPRAGLSRRSCGCGSGLLRVEDFADLAGQGFQGEGLLQEAGGPVNLSVPLELVSA